MPRTANDLVLTRVSGDGNQLEPVVVADVALSPLAFDAGGLLEAKRQFEYISKNMMGWDFVVDNTNNFGPDHILYTGPGGQVIRKQFNYDGVGKLTSIVITSVSGISFATLTKAIGYDVSDLPETATYT